jgi:type IX secretion system PorP/SprF family membrane protein
MKALNLILILIIVLFSFESLKAQDPTFSQFYANRAYLNPAFIGMENGIGFTFTQREQWIKVPKRYTTSSATFEIKPCYWPMALGFSLYRDSEGEGYYLNQGGSLTYSHVVALGENINLHVGARGGFSSKSLRWFNLHFSDEIDPVYGFTNATQAQLTSNRVNDFDLDVGTIVRFETPSSFKQTPIRSAVGIAYNHTLAPEQSLYDGREHRLPKRITIHGGTQIPFASAPRSNYRQRKDRKYYIIPNFKMEFQYSDSTALMKTFSWGAYIQTPLSLYAGLFYQHPSFRRPESPLNTLNAPSFIIVTGYEALINEEVPVVFGLSYDTQPIGLRTNLTGGSLEFSIRIRLDEPRLTCNPTQRANKWNQKQGRNILDCNSFF